MCYDLSFISNIRQVADYLKLPEPDWDFGPTWHRVAQSYTPWPVVYWNAEKQAADIMPMEWCIIADYMNSSDKVKQYRNSMANARSEKISDPKSYWHRIRHQRCLIPTTGFFEHRDVGWKKKIPYFIRLKGQSLFFMAGLYNLYTDYKTGEVVPGFAILTGTATRILEAIHNDGGNAGRMPVILPPGQETQWIRPDLSDSQIRQQLDYRIPDRELEYRTINSIRRSKPDDESVIEPVEYEGLPELPVTG